MVGRYEEIPVEAMNPEQRAVRDAYVSRAGSVPTPYRMYLSSPALATRLEALSSFLVRGSKLTTREVELAILVIAHHVDSKFVMAAHRKGAAKAGWSQDIIDGACSGKDVAWLIADEKERAIYEVARAMAVNRPASMDKYRRYTTVLGQDRIVELAALLGFYCTCAYTVGFHDVPPPAP